MSVILSGVRVASIADVDTVISWINKWRVEPEWIAVINRRKVAISGNVIFYSSQMFEDELDWDKVGRRKEKKKGRTLWVVSNIKNKLLKRYTIRLTHHGNVCCLISYALDGDNLRSASTILSAPSPYENGNLVANHVNVPVDGSHGTMMRRDNLNGYSHGTRQRQRRRGALEGDASGSGREKRKGSPEKATRSLSMKQKTFDTRTASDSELGVEKDKQFVPGASHAKYYYTTITRNVGYGSPQLEGPREVQDSDVPVNSSWYNNNNTTSSNVDAFPTLQDMAVSSLSWANSSTSCYHQPIDSLTNNPFLVSGDVNGNLSFPTQLCWPNNSTMSSNANGDSSSFTQETDWINRCTSNLDLGFRMPVQDIYWDNPNIVSCCDTNDGLGCLKQDMSSLNSGIMIDSDRYHHRDHWQVGSGPTGSDSFLGSSIDANGNQEFIVYDMSSGWLDMGASAMFSNFHGDHGHGPYLRHAYDEFAYQ